MNPAHPTGELSPEDRFRELAAILAAGTLRLHQHQLRAGNSTALTESPESTTTCLELPRATVLTVPTVVNGPRDPEIGGVAWN